MNASGVRNLIRELIDENPLAIRAVLQIVAVEFTESVPTLAVTMETRPRLLINLEFMRRHCATDAHVKAVLCHEFLHVLLRHTALPGRLTAAKHLALDAVINAIIHRQLGDEYSSMMSGYYAQESGVQALLRPMTFEELQRHLAIRTPRDADAVPDWWRHWRALYVGKLVADDIEELAKDLPHVGEEPSLLGSHTHDEKSPVTLPNVLREALERAQREMNGSGIWRGAELGRNGAAAALRAAAGADALRAWKAETLAVLRRHLQLVAGGPRLAMPVAARLPVLSSNDRRAFLRTGWSPFLPDAEWPAHVMRPEGQAQVYLDVSGSMVGEMPAVISLLAQCGRWIRRPFWAFSTLVAPAVIERGELRTDTSGGTSLECVLDHLERTRPPSAVIVTDGYVERIQRDRVARLGRIRLHALVTRDGNPDALRRAGIPYSHLARLPI